MPGQAPAAFQVVRNALSEWWDNLVLFATLNLALLLAWMLILPGPPVLLGMLYALRTVPEGESPSLSALREGIRRYWGHAYLWLALNLIAAFLIATNLWFYRQFGTTAAECLRTLYVFLTAFWFVIQFYALPYLMEQERKHLGIALRNGLFTVLAAPLYTLIVAGFAAVVMLGGTLLIIPLFFGAPLLVLLLGTYAVHERIQTYGLRGRNTPTE